MLLNCRIGSPIDFETVSPADAADLIVAFLQELPEQLIPPSAQSEILASAGNSSPLEHRYQELP